MSSFLDLIQPGTVSEIRDKIRGFCVAAGLKITNWRTGSVGQQMFETNVAMTDFYTQALAKAIRGYASLDTSVDPGDEDQYDDLNATLEPMSGHLSAHGANTFGTTRQGATFATGPVVFTNAAGSGSSARVIAPYGLVFTGTTVDGVIPTYHNVPDDSIYTDGGTITVPVGTSLTIPIECDFIGSRGTRPTGTVSLTTTLIGCSATNAQPITGNDREARPTYVDTCRAASARLSLGGPAAAYEYLARRNLDGSALMNAATPPAPTGITRVYVSSDSATGEVTCYYASASGAPIAEDVTAANLNIEEQCMAVPDAITFTGLAASEANVTVTGTASIKMVAGLDVAAAKQAIVDELTAQWQLWPIGGVDRDSGGSGFIYISDIEGIARSAYAGLYNVNCGPDGSLVIPAGSAPTLTTSTASWTITVVP